MKQPLLATAIAAILMGTATAASAAVFARNHPAERIFPDWPLAQPAPPKTVGAVHVVSTCADSGPDSLRDVMAGVASGDTIDLSGLACGTITLTSGAIGVPVPNLALKGPSSHVLTIEGNGSDRVFLHPYGGMLALENVTITGGAHVVSGFNIAAGGCIASGGTVELRDSVVTGCLAKGEGAYGGAIFSYRTVMYHSSVTANVARGSHPGAGTASLGGGIFTYVLDMHDSIVSGNDASNDPNDGNSSFDAGGGVALIYGGSIKNSTISGNYTHGRGGGVSSYMDVTVANSTISGNVAATKRGGGLFMRQPSSVSLHNSTVAGNTAAAGGGGVALYSDHMTMDSTIVGGNSDGDIYSCDPGAYSYCDALAIIGSHNLVSSVPPWITLPGDTIMASPGLQPLAANGGATPTRIPQAGSPVVDAGSNALGLTNDQRGPGFPRSVGAAPDIGAVEYKARPAPPPAVPVPATSPWWLRLLALALGFGAWRAMRRTTHNSC